MKVDVGDLVAWEPRANIYIDGRHRPRSYGVVMTEEKGYVKIRWNDGKVTVINGQTRVRDSHHHVFSA